MNEADARSGRDRGARRWLVPGLLVLATFAVYANGLNGPFVFDDIGAIVENPHVRKLWPLSEAWSAPPQATVAGRPVVSLSLAVNYALGGYDVRGYHLANVAIHALCGLLVFGIVGRTMRGPKLAARTGQYSESLATACALLWLVHPLCTETVNYVVQRTESLMALCYLGTLYCAVRASVASRPRVWSAAAILACALGMACKEAMVTAPVAVVLYDRAYLTGPFRYGLRRRRALYIGLATTWAILAAIMLAGPRSKTVGLSLGMGAIDYAKNQAVLVAEYLKTAFWPDPLVFDYGYARPLPEGVVGPFVLGVVVLVVLAAVAYWRRPVLGYPAVWVFLILAPTSSFVPIVSEVGAERRMYLPLAGLVVLAVVAARGLRDELARRVPKGWGTGIRLAGIGAVALVVGALAWTTHLRNDDYRSAVALWRTTVAVRPQNPRAHNNLGRALHVTIGPADAIPYYRRALELDDRYSQAHFNLGVALADLGQTDRAIERYRRALQLNPELSRAHHNLGSELANRGRLTEALHHFREAVRHAPESATMWHKLGRALRLSGDTGGALEALGEAVRLDADDWEALGDLAWIRATSPDARFRNATEAIRLAERAAVLTDYRQVTALDTLAAAYASAGRFDDAAATAKRALGIVTADGVRGDLERRLELYLSRQPYYELPPSRAPSPA